MQLCGFTYCDRLAWNAERERRVIRDYGQRVTNANAYSDANSDTYTYGHTNAYSHGDAIGYTHSDSFGNTSSAFASEPGGRRPFCAWNKHYV